MNLVLVDMWSIKLMFMQLCISRVWPKKMKQFFSRDTKLKILYQNSEIVIYAKFIQSRPKNTFGIVVSGAGCRIDLLALD